MDSRPERNCDAISRETLYRETLYVVDLDGTLLTDTPSLSPISRDILNGLLQRGLLAELFEVVGVFQSGPYRAHF